MMRMWTTVGPFLRRNSFLLLLLLAFLLADRLLAWADPMSASLRFYKNDFAKTLLHHDFRAAGPAFFGNSAVTGAYIEEQAQRPLVELGLSYGKLTDLQAILERGLYRPEGQLVVGIDVHTVLDQLETDESYPWFKDWYEPYVYFYRDYMRDTTEEWLKHALRGDFASYEPRWSDKMLYYGRKTPEELKVKQAEYENRFAAMTVKANIDAMDWIVRYCNRNGIPLKVIWMPYHPSFPEPAYWSPLKRRVNATLEAFRVPTLDLTDRFEPADFHDIVHINREVGAPKFTQEVDAWLLSFEKPSK